MAIEMVYECTDTHINTLWISLNVMRWTMTKLLVIRINWLTNLQYMNDWAGLAKA
jgi:hypothetical protein